MRTLALPAALTLVAVFSAGFMLGSRMTAVPAAAEARSHTISPEAIHLQIDPRTLPETEVSAHM